MKILITGGSGRIGKHVVNYLAKSKNRELWLLQKNLNLYKRHQTIQVDLLQNLEPKLKAAFIKYDIIIHMAAITHRGDSKKLGNSNLKITQNLLNFVKVNNQDTPFVFFSSVDVYGIKNKRYPISAKSECYPSSYYGKAKLLAEKILNDNLSTVYILRIAPMIDYEGKVDFLKRVYIPGTKVRFRSPYKRQNSFSDINSICKVIDLYLSGKSESIVNVTNGKIYSERDLLVGSNYSIKFPKIILDLVFFILNRTPGSRFYALEHKFYKLFKTNTYV